MVEYSTVLLGLRYSSAQLCLVVVMSSPVSWSTGVVKYCAMLRCDVKVA